MAEEKKAKEAGGISTGGAVIAVAAIAGVFGLAYLLYRYEQNKAKEYQDLLESYEREVIELSTYQADSPTSEGVQARKNLLDMKALRGQALNTSWIRDFANSTKEVFQAAGYSFVWPATFAFAVLVGGLVIYWLYRNRPKGPGNFTCPLDGQLFITEAALLQHNQTAHKPTTVTANIVSAQATTMQEAQWVQDVIAVQSATYLRERQAWETLQPNEIVWLATALEVAVGYGMTGTWLQAAAALLLI